MTGIQSQAKPSSVEHHSQLRRTTVHQCILKWEWWCSARTLPCAPCAEAQGDHERSALVGGQPTAECVLPAETRSAETAAGTGWCNRERPLFLGTASRPLGP